MAINKFIYQWKYQNKKKYISTKNKRLFAKLNKPEKAIKVYTFHSPMTSLDIKALHTTIARFSKEKKRQVPKN